jgi:ATP-dependent Clp protease ATP-binding subunit ClpX
MTTYEVRYRCSFCEKDEDAVKKLIAGPHGVFICNECVTMATATLRAEAATPTEPT